MPRFYVIHLLLSVCHLLWFSAVGVTYAGEPVARIEQVGKSLTGKDNRYRITLQSFAWLSNITINNFKIAELSGLAWDHDEQLLYALSDNGYLLHLEPRFSNRQLISLALVHACSLLDENGKVLKYKPSDSEGLVSINSHNSITGDTELLVSFERIPRILRYSVNGNLLETLELPDVLADISHYHSENKSLESVVIHPDFGVITGTELPLHQDNDGEMNIYSLAGKHWSFPAFNPHYGALVDLAVMEDAGILALERAYGGLVPVMEITLHRLVLENDKLQHEIIYTFDSRDGDLDENFEGITHHEGNNYFMISDDNNNPFNRTLLVYFSISPVEPE